MNLEIENAYRKLLGHLDTKKYIEKHNETVVFGSIKGKRTTELMLVGRATNGWHIYYDKEKNSKNPNDTNSINDVILKLRAEWKKDLVEIINGWKKDSTYNKKRSQFWQVGERIAQLMVDDSENVFDHVLYSNLYKVASDGNPSQRLKNATDKNCIEILRLEIEYYKPKRILFLTGYDWAEPFLRLLDFQMTAKPTSNLIGFVGKYNGIEVVVAVHPQGKKIDDVVAEISKAFNPQFQIQNS